MATGTEKVIGFLMKSQRPLDEHYLNEGVAWADEAAVLAGIPSGSRSQYKIVNIAGVLYWFKSDLTTLEEVSVAMNQTAAEVDITDSGELYDATNVEDALAEVMSAHNTLAQEVEDMSGLSQTVFTINLSAQSTVASRVAAATETTDYPTGWVLAADSSVNLLITHTLTGRKIAGVNVFEIDGSDERLLKPFESAYSGVLGNGLTVKIEGFAPTLLAVRVELFFNL
jgi:hypothetical protein